jgi:transcriptional regulator with XRE-family HTH domain
MSTHGPLGIDMTDASARIQVRQADNAYALIERLRARRLALGWSQAFVARRMHRDPAVVSNIERLGADPRWSSVRRYASALDVVIDYELTPREALEISAAGAVRDEIPELDASAAVASILAAR